MDDRQAEREMADSDAELGKDCEPLTLQEFRREVDACIARALAKGMNIDGRTAMFVAPVTCLEAPVSVLVFGGTGHRTVAFGLLAEIVDGASPGSVLRKPRPPIHPKNPSQENN